MGRAPVTARPIDFSDVQGLVHFGYKSMPEATYALVEIKNPAAARAWLHAAPITSAAPMKPPPSHALQVAFTADGFAALGVPKGVLAGFSGEFLGGMTESSRARRLGDVGTNASSGWDWGGAGRLPHLIVMFFAERGGLQAFVQKTTGGSWNDAFDVGLWLPTSDLDGVEPFGFADGISQPEIDWSGVRDTAPGHPDYTNIVARGEFLLGYRNEYGKFTERPIVDANQGAADLAAAEDAPDKKDLGLNGTYLVMRQLQQDVRAFWQFVNAQARGNWAEAEKLAASMVGRTRSGEPLVRGQSEPIPGIKPESGSTTYNQFTFDRDAAGASCPFGAHIRRANPRNTDLPGHATGLAKLIAALGLGRKHYRDDLTSSVRFHRILRRGREYGPGLSPTDALQPEPPGELERGLYFIGLNANISRQFEFLQNAWMTSTKFDGMTGESDPLLGNREAVEGCPATADFKISRDGAIRRRVSGLPKFVTVRGGAYFFLPGLRALRYLSSTSRD